MPKDNKKNNTEQDFLPKKVWRRPFLVVLFILINVIVIAVTAIAEFGNSKNAAKLSEVSINWWLLVPAVSCFIAAILFEICKYYILMKKMSRSREVFNARKSWGVATRTVLLGKYYDNITPAAVGGQPFQIYYMHKNGNMPNGLATTIPIIGMISGQIGFIIIAILCFLFGSLSINNATLIATACFGLLFYAFWPIMVIIATFLPNATKDLINVGVRFLAKIHIIKNKKEAIEKIEYEVDEYAKSVKKILKTKGLFFRTVLLSILFNGLVAVIPYFVLTAFGGNVSFLPCFVTTVAVTSAVYFVPTPGNAGAAEGTFFLVFSALSSGYVFWAMLVWRFFSYYIYLIMGPIIYFLIHIKGKVKNHDI